MDQEGSNTRSRRPDAKGRAKAKPASCDNAPAVMLARLRVRCCAVLCAAVRCHVSQRTHARADRDPISPAQQLQPALAALAWH